MYYKVFKERALYCWYNVICLTNDGYDDDND